jgi:hypothetical protein
MAAVGCSALDSVHNIIVTICLRKRMPLSQALKPGMRSINGARRYLVPASAGRNQDRDREIDRRSSINS